MINFKAAQTALQMIAAGHSVETVMNVTGLEPDEMLEILNKVLGEEPGSEPRKVHVVEHVLETIETDMLGEFDVNVN